MAPSKLSAVFVGGQSLLIRCAERFAEHGHELRAIVSGDPAVERWAQEQGIPCIPPGPGLASRVADHPFDYLLSVANLAVIPAEVLALPRRGAVNFHDGPLPECAGLNVTSWALLNGHREHGVTWHLMTEQVDAGDILEEERFPIEGDDTALALNAKCYDAALRTFDKLLVKLARGAVQPRRQDLQRRRYYPRHKRPWAAGSVDWSRPAEDVAALVRALDFGPYPNPLTTAKIWLGDTPVVVRRAEVLSSESRQPAGTVTRVADDAVTVSTCTREVALRDFATLLGAPLAVHDLAKEHGLAEGASIRWRAHERGRTLTGLDAAVSRHEDFWLSRLAKLEPIEIPFVKRHPGRGPGAHLASRLLATPVPFQRRFEAAPGDALLAALCAYLSRVGGQGEFTVAFRHAGLDRIASDGLGLFSPHVPLPVRLDSRAEVGPWFERFLAELASVRRRATYPLDLAQRQPGLGASARSWHEDVPAVLLQRVPSLAPSSRPPAAAGLTWIVPDDGRSVLWLHDADLLDPRALSRMEEQLRAMLGGLAEADGRIGEIGILSSEEEQQLARWNGTETAYPRQRCVHQLFEAAVQRAPERVALAFRDEELTYAALNARANQNAHSLIGRGIGPGALVGVLMERSAAMVAGMMGILKAGAAYVPLDPAYPRDRLAFMVEDAALAAVLTQARYRSFLPGVAAPMIAVDRDGVEGLPVVDPITAVRPDDLAYVIYTSGSTGRPKGVMVEHRNVVNFFAGMDGVLDCEEPVTWLAVTSICFDISALEIFWPLAHGFKVVLHGGEEMAATPAASGPPLAHADVPMAFSLFYFASDEGERGRDKYQLLLEGARFADRNGFQAVWTPERHFHAFGGLFPNPSVVSAAIAVITRQVKIRAGSCVLPLHNPIRIVEEWALVDNLSSGRAGVSFASGWQPDDFVIAPGNYDSRHEVFYRGIETVRALWRGERRSFPGPKGEVETRPLPRPVQPELPCWVTAAGNPETFRKAGEIGANLLTHLLGQSIDELAGKLETYRRAWRDSGHPGRGQVTLMLHAFVGDSEAQVRSQVHGPLKEYLRGATDLLARHASSFPAFRRAGRHGSDGSFQSLSEQDMDALLEHAFERYYRTSGLFGTPRSCLPLVDGLKGIGVDEVACLIDFGVPSDVVLAHLPHLDEVRRRANAPGDEGRPRQEHGIPALLARHGVTHLQCTPSMARMLTRDAEARVGLRQVKNLLVGGEVFPSDLGAELRGLVSGRVLNMYGPTETTVWSATHDVTDTAGSIPIGRPIANTRIHVVDADLGLLPAGVPGELLIGGDGVARGYLNRPELTAQRFVADPFMPGARLYRTGDRARWREDGCLEFLGRVDDQVKIRGHRIELGEIEAVLARHPAVRQAAVAARREGPGDTRLVGYVVLEKGQAATAGELRDHLNRDLPEFMVPGAFVTLDSLPLTPNGKVDRKSLPPPNASRPEIGGAYQAPRTPTEAVLAGFFQETIGLEQVGIHDSFLELGGDSLAAVDLFVRIEERFHVEFPLATFFQVPTVAGLAQEIERALAGSRGSDAAPGRDGEGSTCAA